MEKIFISGVAGFIGFSLAHFLLKNNVKVFGYDGLTEYGGKDLKKNRLKILTKYKNFTFTEGMLENSKLLSDTVADSSAEAIVHLAAQAGVRYSISNPKVYIDSNVVGTFNILEAALKSRPKHLLIASTSSVYGANETMPYSEIHKSDNQMSIYAATKKATENLAHSWAHIHQLPITVFRFFTVYGPWGRTDMAPFKFARAIQTGKPLDVYNKGNLWRDFTYIDDIVTGINLLASTSLNQSDRVVGDSLSKIAPFRIVNIGNSEKIHLESFIEAFENSFNKKAIKNYLSMQPGDVYCTWSDTRLLKELTGFKPNTPMELGVKKFCDWFKIYYA